MRRMSLGYFAAKKKKRQFLYISSCHGKFGMSFSALSNAVAKKIFFFFLKYGFSTQKLVLKDLISVPV